RAEGDPMSPLPAPEPRPERFEGHDGRECGEHHTTGPRAWCSNCQEWCYPGILCRGCELPLLRQRAAQAEAAVQRVRYATRTRRAGAPASAAMDGPKPVHDARPNACAHIEDARRTPTNPGGPEETR